MKRKPGETIPELASRIRQDAATCDFQSIKDPLDEALRTKFICSVDNEAVLKALFKLKDDELKFSNAIRVAQEVEEAAKVAKETVYKMLSNLAAQQQPVKSIHELTMNDIQTFMAEQFNPKRFVVRERFKFWSDMKRKPGETIPELASRIRQDAATCDFQSIKDPLDEA